MAPRPDIETVLREKLSATVVTVRDQSDRHVGHRGATSGGGHFELTVVSEMFRGKSPLERHRLVYDALGALMRSEIHALAMRALTPEEATAEAAGKDRV